MRPDSGHVVRVMDARAEDISKSLPCMLGNPRLLQSLNQMMSARRWDYPPAVCCCGIALVKIEIPLHCNLLPCYRMCEATH